MVRKAATDRPAHLLRIFRRGNFTGSYRPYRLISHYQPRQLRDGHAAEPAVQLAEGVAELLPRLPHRQGLADAQHGRDAGPQGRLQLGVHHLVILAVVLAPLRMSDQHVPAAELGQHRAGYLAGIGTLVVGRDVLGPVANPQLVPGYQGLHAAQRGERRQDRDVRGIEVPAGQHEGQLLGEGKRLEMVLVHLPVAGHQRLAGILAAAHPASSSAASPGSCLPSRYPRLAPPPVEMWLNSLSLKPRARTAAAESPPPTTVSPGTAAIALATARVPAAKAENSKTPTGPFQNTVRASAILAANSSRVAGPMSRLSRSAGKSVTGKTSCSASAA